eukprot:14039671-Alexandrium_andersonii.AAC.1
MSISPWAASTAWFWRDLVRVAQSPLMPAQQLSNDLRGASKPMKGLELAGVASLNSSHQALQLKALVATELALELVLEDELLRSLPEGLLE